MLLGRDSFRVAEPSELSRPFPQSQKSPPLLGTVEVESNRRPLDGLVMNVTPPAAWRYGGFVVLAQTNMGGLVIC